jgi:hypothetical protein
VGEVAENSANQYPRPSDDGLGTADRWVTMDAFLEGHGATWEKVTPSPATAGLDPATSYSVAAPRPGCSALVLSIRKDCCPWQSRQRASGRRSPSPTCCQGYGTEAGSRVSYRAVVSHLRLRLGCGKDWKWLLYWVEGSEVS